MQHFPRLRVAIVTNIPAPYRVPVWGALAREADIELCVVFCSGREPDRAWDLGQFDFEHVFLKERYATVAGRFVHANADVWPVLSRWRPDLVVTTGFNPTHLLAFAWTRLRGALHVAMTDGTVQSEFGLTALHRALRRHVYARSVAFIGASEGSFALYRSYGVRPSAMFKSHLCADNSAFIGAASVERDIDLMFCARFVAVKRPLFALQVAAATAERLGRRLRVLFVGSGVLEAELRQAAKGLADRLDVEFPGFACQSELPGHYARAKLLLFPTTFDPWGVVANEACASGVPVLTCPVAGVATELVRDGENGLVMPLDLAAWTEGASWLLADDAARSAMALRGRELVQPYTYVNAAAGLAAALRHARRERPGNWQAHPPGPAIVPSRQRPRVVIVQRRLTGYRVPLFEQMKALLDRRGIDLALVVGDPTPGERLKADAGALHWAHHVPCNYLWGGRLCWQWAWPLLKGADLAIVTQENKLLLNYFLMTKRRRLPLAFWGHGRNFQAGPRDHGSEWLKRQVLKQVDWWFAYTDVSREQVVGAGFDPHRVTVLNNAVDTLALQDDLRALDGESDSSLRHRFELGPGPVVLVLSSLYATKRIDFLLEVARLAQERRPDLQLLVAGDGPDRHRVQDFAARHPWVRWIGARTGLDKAACLRVSSAILQPHHVGLVALDSLVAGVPLVTLPDADHAPEISYLRAGENCVVAERADLHVCAAALTGLLGDAALQARLAWRCRLDAQGLGIEAMTQRFCDGIVLAMRGVPLCGDMASAAVASEAPSHGSRL